MAFISTLGLKEKHKGNFKGSDIINTGAYCFFRRLTNLTCFSSHHVKMQF